MIENHDRVKTLLNTKLSIETENMAEVFSCQAAGGGIARVIFLEIWSRSNVNKIIIQHAIHIATKFRGSRTPKRMDSINR